MVNGVNGNSPAQQLSSAIQQDKSLGKNAFLKLLVEQLKNQDPLKPQDNSTFVAELAQFSNLEQVTGINDRLDLLSAQGQGLQNTEIAGLVGQRATVKGSTITLDGSGNATQIAFTLEAPAEQTQVVITDASGATIRTLDVGAKGAGLQKVNWDGKNKDGAVQPAGPYTVSVQARGANDSVVSVSQNATGIVRAVGFEKGYPELQLDNGLSVPVASLLRVEASTTTTHP